MESDNVREAKAILLRAEGAKIVGIELMKLFEDQSQWSQATFGTDLERGPIGALKHLAEEATEAAIAEEATEAAIAEDILGHNERPARVAELKSAALTERADCLLLLLDANRRAGSSVLELIRAAQAKMVINRARTFPKPTSDVPSHHVHDVGGES